MIKIIAKAVTYRTKDGEVKFAIKGDLPDNCVAIFVSQYDYKEAERLLGNE